MTERKQYLGYDAEILIRDAVPMTEEQRDGMIRSVIRELQELFKQYFIDNPDHESLERNITCTKWCGDTQVSGFIFTDGSMRIYESISTRCVSIRDWRR